MANQRAEDQEFIGIWVSNSLACKIDEDRGSMPRSQWVRSAIADLLLKQGFTVSFDEKSAPDRVKHKKPLYRTKASNNIGLNEKASSSVPSVVKPSVAKVAEKLRHEKPKSS